MRYASIRELDVTNGEGIGIALFAQGCRFFCKDCFNPETWDFNSGQEWTEAMEDDFLRLANRSFIKRISILGGEALASENLTGVLQLLNKIRFLFKNEKTIWLYTGYKWEQLFTDKEENSSENAIRRKIISMCDVVVDGRFEKELADINYPYAGSTNQRVIDVKKSIREEKVVLWKN